MMASPGIGQYLFNIKERNQGSVSSSVIAVISPWFEEGHFPARERQSTRIIRSPRTLKAECPF